MMMVVVDGAKNAVMETKLINGMHFLPLFHSFLPEPLKKYTIFFVHQELAVSLGERDRRKGNCQESLAIQNTNCRLSRIHACKHT